ncbi:MAG: GAF domain-containing protein [candidate division Zixibacteria bacterium]|nr:GAF domain-containing protein [candidate division Zixibacteria bacterium]
MPTENKNDVAAPFLGLAEKRLRNLVDISRAFSEEVELSALLALVARRTSEAMGTERTSVFLHDPERRELWTVVAEGEPREIRMPEDAGIAGWVATRGEVAVVSDVTRDPRWNKEIDRRTGYTTRNILCVPMDDPGGERLGAFQCLNRAEGNFTQDDVTFLQAIASQAAVYIQNARLLEARKRMFDSLVDTLAETIESRDPLTAGHSRNVMAYAVGTAKKLGLPPEDVEVIRYAALLHDYGKIGLPDDILRKPTTLTPAEYEVIKKHVFYTQQILARIHFEERLKEVPVVAAHHHERLDGSGYPEALAGDGISFGGKIIAVADVFDAMTSRRHYRGPMTVPQAVDVITEGAGSQFDAETVRALKRFLIEEGRLEPDEVD